jgi:hypothetical protein
MARTPTASAAKTGAGWTLYQKVVPPVKRKN